MLKRFFTSSFLALAFAMAILTAAVAPLQGCASLGVPAADTINKKAAEGYIAITAAANSVTTLRAAGKMSETDRNNTVATLQTAKSGLDAAVKQGTTDPTGAQTNLDRIMLVLNALTAALAAQQAGVK